MTQFHFILLRLCYGITAAIILLPLAAFSHDLIPDNNSALYYQIGGGNDIPLPAFFDTDTIPLNANARVGLGLNCAGFNPQVALTHSLNQIKSSFIAVTHKVLNRATAAITMFPLYELSRADPNLYNLITSNIARAQADIALSTKSCEAMQAQIAAGQDPYAHWMQLSLGNRWKQEIGDTTLSSQADINQSHYNVGHDGGNSGVLWIPSDYSPQQQSHSTPYYAGGQGQAPIHVIHDVVIAGYRVMIQDHQHATNPNKDTHNFLTQAFPTAKAAAHWVTHVVGDDTVTTYNNGEKSSQPGVGLIAVIQQQQQIIQPKLQALVDQRQPLTLKNLQAISPTGIALSPEMIQRIRQQPSLTRQIIIGKLAQNIAALTVIDQARLTVQLLQAGATIPEVYSNGSAQQRIDAAIKTLQQQVSDLLLFIKARNVLVANLLTTLLQTGIAQERHNTTIAPTPPTTAVMTQGAIPQNKSH